MSTGILPAIATGLLWTGYGIVPNCGASRKLALVPAGLFFIAL